VRPGRDHDLVGSCQRLQAGRKVRQGSDDRVQIPRPTGQQVADDDASRREADPGAQGPACDGPQAADPRHNLHGGPDRTLGIVLVGHRIAEVGKDAVTDEARDVAAITSNRLAAELPVIADEIDQVLAVQRLGELGGPHEVGEQNRHDAVLAGFEHRLGRGIPCPPRCSLALESPPLTHGEAEFPEVFVRQI
jgi:hypothetical protein